MLQEEELPEVVVVVDFETKEFLRAAVEFTRSKEAADRRPSSAVIGQTVAVVKASPNQTASRCPCRR